MYRKLLAVMLGVMLVFGAAGCSEKKDTSDTSKLIREVSVQDDEDASVGTGDEAQDTDPSENEDTSVEDSEDEAQEDQEDNADTEADTDREESDPDIRPMDETAYVVSPVNFRDAPNTDSNVLGALQSGESVHCTGRYSNGWTRIEYNGQSCYVYGSYLSTGTGKEDSSSSNSSEDDVEVVDAIPTPQD